MPDTTRRPMSVLRVLGLPIRFVVMLPLVTLSKLGRGAERIGTTIDPYLPRGLEK